jgi:hypothetical protein
MRPVAAALWRKIRPEGLSRLHLSYLLTAKARTWFVLSIFSENGLQSTANRFRGSAIVRTKLTDHTHP